MYRWARQERFCVVGDLLASTVGEINHVPGKRSEASEIRRAVSLITRRFERCHRAIDRAKNLNNANCDVGRN